MIRVYIDKVGGIWGEAPGFALSSEQERGIAELREDKRYRELDRVTLLSILSARYAFSDSNWIGSDDLAVNIGSSRGATALFERSYAEFLERGSVPLRTSPHTTLGNVSSYVAEELEIFGYDFSHSATCTSSHEAIANGLAWIRSGMVRRFVAGGAEAPLTEFTRNQMLVLGLTGEDSALPCRPLNAERQNTFRLGEGAAVFGLTSEKSLRNLCEIEAVGLARESIKSASGISESGEAFGRAMQLALSQLGDQRNIDAIFMHAPGVRNGDEAELRAIRRVFGESVPFLVSNKWKYGHTLGASGALSLYEAIDVLRGNSSLYSFPYATVLLEENKVPNTLKRIMINSAGFGGNAASIVICSGS